MYEGHLEELTRATMADHDRVVNRLLLEREALRAAAEKPAAAPQTHRGHLPWAFGSRRPTALN